MPTTCRRCTAAAVGLLTLAVSLAGCARPDDWIETQPDLAARARADPGSFLQPALSQWDGLRGMAGTWQVRASRGIRSRTVDAQIYLLRDALVQIEMLSPGFTTEGFVGVSRREVGMWVSEDPCLYRGPNEPGAFGRALGIDLEPEDILAVLMGYAVPYPERAAAAWDETERRIRVTSSGTTAWLHPVTLRFERFVVETPSGPIDGRYEAWTDGELPVPARLRVEVEQDDIALDLRLADEWQADPEGLDEAFFEQLPVDATTSCSLDQLARDGGLLWRGMER